MKFFAVTLLIAQLAFSAGEGGWVGMGGELFKDARNPWFVRNTKEVFYCIDVDPKQISVTADQINLAFYDALSYWKGEFSRATLSNGYFELGTQKFTLVNCSFSGVDYRLIFGSSFLNEKQIEFLKDPSKYIGVTVRTDYNEVQLKAQGFSYFTNDLSGNKSSPTFLEKAWSYPKILRYALMHELGHLFGLPHFGTGLMSEIFLDQLVKPEYLDRYLQASVESVIQPDPSVKMCTNLNSGGRQFLTIPQNHECVRLQPTGPQRYTVFSYKDTNSVEANELGTLALQTPNLDEISGRPVSFLQLTEKQDVFSAQERQFRLFMLGPIALEMSAKGKFIPKNPGATKSVYFKITPTQISLLGLMPNQDITPVLNYTSALGLIYLIPTTP